MYDYVHLQKCVRNNLLTKDLIIDANVNIHNHKFASWKDIATAYDMDVHTILEQRLMPKLTNKHIDPKLIPKMRVRYATQVLSHTVARFINTVVMWKQGEYIINLLIL